MVSGIAEAAVAQELALKRMKPAVNQGEARIAPSLEALIGLLVRLLRGNVSEVEQKSSQLPSAGHKGVARNATR